MSEILLTVIAPVFLASLLGSPHCAAMCGGFVTFCAKDGRGVWVAAALYNSGRLVTYALATYGVSLVSSAFSPMYVGLVLVVWGLLSFGKVNVFPKVAHQTTTRWYINLIRKIPRGSKLFPFVTGLASTLLPCGWLYVYVGVAAVSQHPMITIVSFWLGTLPILTAWSGISSWCLARLGGYFPVLRSSLLVIAGLTSVIQHVSSAHSLEDRPHHCHASR